MFAVVLRYADDTYRVLFVDVTETEAADESAARFRAYDLDREGSIVAVERVPALGRV